MNPRSDTWFDKYFIANNYFVITRLVSSLTAHQLKNTVSSFCALARVVIMAA